MNTVRLPHQRHPFVTLRPLAIMLVIFAVGITLALTHCA